MKRFIHIIALIAGAVVIFSGCAKSDHLDTSPSYAYSSENVWNTSDLANAAVTGVYNTLYTLWIWQGRGTYATDAYASVMDPVNNWRQWILMITGDINPSNTNVQDWYWRKYWELIRRANDVIANIDKVPDDQLSAAQRNELKCECLFFRAWGYYYLATMWGDVPLVTEPLTEDELLQLTRTPQKTVYEQCVSDLTACVNDPTMPGRTTNGRVSKGAAYAYRGIIYQFLGDWSKALADFEAIEKLGFALFSPSGGAPGNDDFKELFKPANEHCPEFIFGVECYPESGMGNDRARSHYGNRDTGASGWDGYYPNPGYVELFENADGSTFDWEEYCPGWNNLTDQERAVFFLRNGLIDGSNGHYGTSEATAWNESRYTSMKNYCGEKAMTYYLDDGNEQRLRRAYENRDPRLELAVITPYAVYEGYVSGIGSKPWVLRWPYIIDTVEPYDLRTDSPYMFCYLWRKYVPEHDEWTIAWTYPENLSLVRYAEVLLRRAECLNELGRTSEAMKYVDMVRARSGHIKLSDPGYKGTDVSTQEGMRQKIRNEMYVELGGEESMYFLELRWGVWHDKKFRNQTNGRGNGLNGRTYKDADLNTNGLQQCWGSNYGYNITVGEHCKLWPIPAKEREMNPNLTQNPGYMD